MNDAAVSFRDVTVRRGALTLLESITADVPRGSATAIIGPNGAGKTTLLLAMLRQISFAGVIDMPSGSDGRPVRIGYVPQRLDFDRGMPLTVLEMMAIGWQRLPVWFGVKTRARARAMELLASVRADHLARRPLGVLSGGELQRVLLALAMQQDPEVLVMDEPSAGVDVGGENLLCEVLETLRGEKGFTQIMVTHDLAVVTAHATHVICLNRRVMGQGPTRQTLTLPILAATFGLHLGLADLHVDHSRCRHGHDDAHEHDADCGGDHA